MLNMTSSESNQTAPCGTGLDSATAYERVKRVLVEEMSVDEDRIAPDASLAELAMDSLEFVDLVLELEEEFGIEVPDDDFRKLRTIQDIADYAKRAHFAKTAEALV